MMNTRTGQSRFLLFPALLASACLFSARPTLAQETEAGKGAEDTLEVPDNFTQVQHIIRPGDTFISITREFLGSKRWELNSRLNPEQKELQLPPGERMNILIDPERVPLAARVTKRAGTVEAQPSPMSWLGAEANDLLIEKDAARTKRNSSAELQFHDGTTVVITEESLVFIRKLGRGLSTVARNRTTQQVELVQGQADLSSLAGSQAVREDVEIIMGGSTLKLPKESPVRTRTSMSDAGTQKVGMYEGGAQFEGSGGSVLEIATGEGVVAKANETPVKEHLLPAPELNGPPPGAQLVAGQLPPASWTSPGTGANSYTFEVCRDAECGRLLQRTTGLDTTEQPLPRLSPGFYYWRATAASASGLDGYPSDSRMFQVVAVPLDAVPPEVAIDVTRFGVPFQGLQAYGPKPPITTSISDEGTGVERSGLMINGQEHALDLALPTGRTSLAVFAVDRAGHRSESQAVEMFIDATAPTLKITGRDAPSFEKRITQRPRSKRALLRAKKEGATYAPNSVFALAANEPLAFSLDDIEWRPLAFLETGLLTNSTTLQLAINEGYCLRAVDSQDRTDADDACGRYLTITATDEHTGVKVLRARLEDGTLIIQATDEVANLSELRYRVVSN